MPAGISLFLYLLHGWRQYNLRMIDSMFHDRLYIRITKDGGMLSSIFHFVAITIPNIIDVKYMEKLLDQRFKKRILNIAKFVPVFPVVFFVECNNVE